MIKNIHATLNLFRGVVLKPFPIVLIGLVLMSLGGCLKMNQPVIEDITSGSKWNLRIGDPTDSIYQSLKELGEDRKFYSVAVVGRQPFDAVDEIREFFPYYNWFSFQSSVGQVDRLLVGLDSGKVSALYAGGAMLDSLGQWPEHLDDEEAVIYHGDTFDELQAALEAIQNHSQYSTYHYVLPDKPLELPFDPDMDNFGQWYFTFQEVGSGAELQGTSEVTLFIEEGDLVRIHHVFTEF